MMEPYSQQEAEDMTEIKAALGSPAACRAILASKQRRIRELESSVHHIFVGGMIAGFFLSLLAIGIMGWM